MTSDLREALQILSLYKSETLTYGNAKDILQKICADTDDWGRKQNCEFFYKNQEYCIELFLPVLSYVSDKCYLELCQECVINKWCNKYRSDQQKAELKKKEPTYADFFCGAGGLSLGFHRAGFRMSLANDIQECCVNSISFNHPEVPERNIIAGDINDVVSKITQYSRYENIDVVIGGPPCQGFSMANRQRVIDDPRNHLYKSYVKAIATLRPKFFVMENVRGMLNVKDQVIQNFEQIGYSAAANILNAKDFGIPQNRERVIFIGNRIGINNFEIFDEIFANGRESVPTVLMDALYNLPPLQAKTIANHTEMEDNKSGYTFTINNSKSNGYLNLINGGTRSQILYNHKARYNNKRDIEIYSRLNPGDNSSDPKIADIMPYGRRGHIFKDKYYKLEPNKPCKTITAHMKYDCNMYIHPYQARGLTPREAARVQSFPDNYYFRGSYTKTYMQVGNSVPPLLSEIIAKAIKQRLKVGE